MLRNIIGAFTGLVAGMFVVILSQRLMPNFYMPQEGLDFTNPDDIKTFVDEMPFNAKGLMIIGHTWGAIMAGLVGASIAKVYKFRTGFFAAFVIVIATISFNFRMYIGFSFSVCDILLTLLAAYVGARLGSKGEVIIDA